MPDRRLLLAPLLALTAAAPAQGAERIIGSDLSVPATSGHADGNDWAAWNTSLPGEGLVRSPVQGEINSVTVKGFMQLEGKALKPPDVPGYGTDVDIVLHVAVLRPQGDGTVKMVNSAVSEDLPLPYRYTADGRQDTDPNQTYTYGRKDLVKPDGPDGKGGGRLCIQEGDYIAYAPTGGFGGDARQNPEQIYVNGVNFKVFGSSRAQSAIHNQGGAFTDDPFRGASRGGRELLLQATIGTREDARYTCRTKAEQDANLDYVKPVTPPPVVPVVTVPGQPATPTPATGTPKLVAPKRAPKVKRGKVSIPLSCTGTGPCAGRLSLRTYSSSVAFTLAPGQTTKVVLKLKKSATKKLTRKGAKLTVKALLAPADGSRTQSIRFLIQRV